MKSIKTLFILFPYPWIEIGNYYPVTTLTITWINTMERSLLEKINHRTLLLESCIMSSYFESTISNCSDASILYTLWTITCASLLKYLNSYSPGLCVGINFPARVNMAFTSPISIKLTTSSFSLMTRLHKYSM